MMGWCKKIWGRSAEPSFNIPVLCYHSWTVNGHDYGINDHVSLEQDLRVLAEQGYEIISPLALVELIESGASAAATKGKKLVCLTFDDGRDYDYCDYVDKKWGPVKSFHKILTESADYISQFDSGPRGLSFVIASPEARSILDSECGRGRDEWRDAWWAECAAEGILGIANHSWDHVHDVVQQVRQQDNRKGSFFAINTFADAESQIAEAQTYIDRMTNGKALPVFGYPYGEAPEYLVKEYFPQNGKRLGLRAAFSTEAGYATRDSNIWNIPRFVCGFHWKTQLEFLDLLKAAEQQTKSAHEAPLDVREILDEPAAPDPVEAAPVEANLVEADLVVENPAESLLVTEVSDAEPIVGDLFRRRFFTDSFPDTPCHYIAFIRYRDGTLCPVGYVHYTLTGQVALCGGLVIDNRQFRKLPKQFRQALHESGGIAEALLRESFQRLPESISTIWGHVGDLQSEKVCLRVGFERTREKYLLVVWRKSDLPGEERERLIDHVAAMTPF